MALAARHGRFIGPDQDLSFKLHSAVKPHLVMASREGIVPDADFFYPIREEPLIIFTPARLEKLRKRSAFAPNAILSGSHKDFDEDLVSEIAFSEASLMARELCVRCELPNISRRDARRGRQPVKTIGSMSRERSAARPASFGICCAAKGESLDIGMGS